VDPGKRNARDYAAGLDYTKISMDLYTLADALARFTFVWMAREGWGGAPLVAPIVAPKRPQTQAGLGLGPLSPKKVGE
jgi:hypothetical protein